MTILLLALAFSLAGQNGPSEAPRIESFAIEHDLDQPEDVHFPEGSPVGYVSNINGDSTAPTEH